MTVHGDVERLQRRFWGRYGWWSQHRDRCRGRRHGRRGLPPLTGSGGYRFRENVIAGQRGAVARFMAALEKLRDRLRKRLARLTRRLDQKLIPRLRRLERRLDEELENLDRSLGPFSARYQGLETSLAQARSRFQRDSERLGRLQDIHFERSYVWIMSFLAVAEVPINRLAFELFFMETPFISFILSLVAGTLLVLLAHWCGMFARRATDDSLPAVEGDDEERDRVRRRRVMGNVSGVVVTILILVPFIYYMALLRQTYVNFIEGEIAGDLERLIEQAQTTEVATQALSTELGDAGIFLLALNSTIFVAASLLSFFRHDPNQGFQNAYEQKERLQRKLDALERRYGRKRAGIRRNYEERISAAEAAKAQTEELKAETEKQLQGLEEQAREVREQAFQSVRTRLSNYEEGNLMARSKGEMPECFQYTERELRDRFESRETGWL